MSLPTCAHCNATSPTLKRCSRCKDVSYCNTACQKADWRTHKPDCLIELPLGQVFAVEFLRFANPDKSRPFPLFCQYFDDCEANAQAMLIPRVCHTRHIGPDGLVTVVVHEERWQEYLVKRAQRKAKEKAETAAMYEESILDGGSVKAESEQFVPVPQDVDAKLDRRINMVCG